MQGQVNIVLQSTGKQNKKWLNNNCIEHRRPKYEKNLTQLACYTTKQFEDRDGTGQKYLWSRDDKK